MLGVGRIACGGGARTWSRSLLSIRRPRSILAPTRGAIEGHLRSSSKIVITRRSNSNLASDSCPETLQSYTIKVEGTVIDEKTKNLSAADIWEVFGAFEPYNVKIIPPPADPKAHFAVKKGERPTKTFPLATFQVPSLMYAQEIVNSFHHDETWGERITVQHGAEMYPVFLNMGPYHFEAEDLKKKIEEAAKCDPKKMKAIGEPEVGGEFDPEANAKAESLLARTHIDVYPREMGDDVSGYYAILRCPDKYTSLGFLQGVLKMKHPKGQKTEDAAVAPATSAAAAATEAGDAEGDLSGDEERLLMDEEAYMDQHLTSYPAWKAWPVRINGLPLSMTTKDLEKTFYDYYPYDIELLPVGPGAKSRSAYIRFISPVNSEVCIEEMDDVIMEKEKGDDAIAKNVPKELKNVKVRPAYEKLFPVIIKGKVKNEADLAQLKSTLGSKAMSPVDAMLIDTERGDAVLQFASAEAAVSALRFLQSSAGSASQVRLGWKQFNIEIANLPTEITETDLREIVHLTSPYEVKIERGSSSSRGKISFCTRPDAQMAHQQLSASGLPDLKLRKTWAFYRLKVKGLPLDTSEADLREVLKGYEPYRIEFPRSRKGNLKGEAVIRFSAYDELVAAVARLYGRDSPTDEAFNRGRWSAAGKGLVGDGDSYEISSMLAGSNEEPPLLIETLEAKKEEKEEVVVAEEKEEEKGKAGGLKFSKAQLKGMVDRALEEEAEGEGAELVERLTGTLVTEEEAEEEEGDQEAWLLEREGEVKEEEEEEEDEEDGGETFVNPFAIATEGSWVKMIVDTDTTQKIVKGGQILSYRCLVVVGNLKGAGGWGMGKGANIEEAKQRAVRAAKKNLIHIDLYRNRCVTTPLYGKHNNCRIYIQAGHPRRPHKEGRMINDMIRVLGVECGEARSVGKRNPYSVVRAVFDALSKHQGVEEISRRRGRRLISVSRARYLGL